MALKSGPVPFPLFPPNLSALRRYPYIPTEVRFSRWNNANAEPFLRRQRLQKEIEDDIRRHRRFHSATKIADASDVGERTAVSPPPEYKSAGTPSSPSSPSIPGKASKYSRPPENPGPSHPAFRRIARSPRRARVPPPEPDGETGVSVSENGIAYKIKDAPFEFQYSYTETPKVKPLALREAPYLPFGPVTMPRPWTGRAPLPPSKKKLPVFDSFRLPPAGKKGVKPVQAPGPFLAGSGPKHTAATREEILGEPLTIEEIKELVQGSLKGKRQLNMGRDGLTHNMLENIHAHWKRRRVCRIKCKGVCTVDMDNVRQQLEEKTGGKIIYGRGGVIHLYRGRNYNYRTRPRFPLMLWKPITPVYPRLVQRAPEGLTLEEATEMRKKGRQLPPIRQLGKNGLYSNLVRDVKEAFEACELVRINCKDMNKSDCRKIGAKLKDLVPCVLLSFEYENILMWRGKDWKSSLAPSEDGDHEAMGHTINAASDSLDSLVKDDEIQRLHAVEEKNEESLSERPGNNMNLVKDFSNEDAVDFIKMDKIEENEVPPVALSFNAAATTENLEFSTAINLELSASGSDGSSCGEVNTEKMSQFQRVDPRENKSPLFPQINAIALSAHVDLAGIDSSGANTRVGIIESVRVPEMLQEETLPCNGMVDSNVPWLERVMLLVKQAVECESAVVLDDDSLNADIVLAKSIDLAKKTHCGPIFRHPSKKTRSQKAKKEKIENSKEEDVETFVFSQRKGDVKREPRSRKNEETFLDVIPHGSLRVDELAKLLT